MWKTKLHSREGKKQNMEPEMYRVKEKKTIRRSAMTMANFWSPRRADAHSKSVAASARSVTFTERCAQEKTSAALFWR
jgi:hypothetical protein